jgi:2-polyprenyl-3-methyl-5-hydroxy-6-metoxy-1,4-benzoquinol methylase
MNINITEKRQKIYYSQIRTWPSVFSLKHAPKILDIGCGQGVLGKYLKDKVAANVCGIEITTEHYNVASTVLDRAVLGDIESMDMTLIGTGFDYVIFSDSLEHLVDPGAILRKIKSLMTEDGEILMSLPNVRNFRVTFPLLFRDKWEYTDEGLLDKTHLRFFTLNSITHLLHESGFQIENFHYDLPLSSKVGILNLLTFGLFRKILTSHYFIKSCIQKRY